VNSEGFREILSEEQQKGPKEAKMAGREEATRGAGGPHDLRSEIGGRKAESGLETKGDLATMFQGEGEQGREGLGARETWNSSMRQCEQVRYKVSSRG
jgi:hypothetical protein